jgi:hypothetical protein
MFFLVLPKSAIGGSDSVHLKNKKLQQTYLMHLYGWIGGFHFVQKLKQKLGKNQLMLNNRSAF